MSKPSLTGLGLGVPSSSRDSSISPLPSPAILGTTHSHGLRSQLGSLLPRHVLFQVHIHVDQLSNVPLVKGQFGVRWKFKNVQSGSGLLSKMKSANSSRTGVVNNESSGKLRKSFQKKSKWRGRGMELALGDESRASTESQQSGQNTPEGPHIQVTSQEDQESAEESDNTTLDDQPTARWTSHPNGSSGQLRRSSSSSNVYTSYITSSPPQTPIEPATAVPDLHLTPIPPPPPSAAPTITKATFTQMSGGSQLQTESRGCTEWAKLRNYNVQWDHKVNVVVQMDVHRETGDILPNELKLVVMQVRMLSLRRDLRSHSLVQRVIHGDPDSPQHPRMGALYLNLAEYVDAGAVTRRYLLRESKTNATLKVRLVGS